MENIMKKLGLYDIFARGLTGIIVILAADLFGVFNLCHAAEDGAAIPVWAILVAGYFCGLVLEEMSYWLEKIVPPKESDKDADGESGSGILDIILISRSRIEQSVGKRDEYKKYDYKRCKNALIADGKEYIFDEPLSHVVMSASFRIAFFIFLILELIDLIPCCDPIAGSFICPVIDILIILALIIIFHLRARHYCQRRAEQIFDYCIAKRYQDIEK